MEKLVLTIAGDINRVRKAGNFLWRGKEGSICLSMATGENQEWRVWITNIITVNMRRYTLDISFQKGLL